MRYSVAHSLTFPAPPSLSALRLASFVRQLSYYGFRRLSDRRKSGEKKNGIKGYIVFA